MKKRNSKVNKSISININNGSQAPTSSSTITVFTILSGIIVKIANCLLIEMLK